MDIDFWHSSYDGRHGKPRAHAQLADNPLQLRRFPLRHWANVPGVHYPQKMADEKALLETNARVYVNEEPDLEKWMPALEAMRDLGISRQRMGRIACPRVMYLGRLFLHRKTLLARVKNFSSQNNTENAEPNN